ncbi:MAG: DUF3891 family protein [Leptolyngbya sp. DLM2.Bin27]|nr:MAG: DUF3891 family protein [Leptolyngbya sp. DLM2.Bin27]
MAMLISMHLCFLNQGQAEQDAEFKTFLNDQRQRQAQWQKELEVSSGEAEAAYRFLRWCDRLSLILAQRQVPVGGRQLDITHGPDDQLYRVYRLDCGHLGVTPWPFSCKKLTVAVDACYLSQLQFATNDELRAALADAPRKTVEWTFAKP